MTNTVNNDTDFGSAFVGGYMLCCARIEEWGAVILASSAQTKADGGPTKIPRMLGPKLKAIADIVASQPDFFAKPKRVSELMSRFASPAKLRSDMAHSTLIALKNGSDTFYLFHTVDSGERFWMTKTDMQNSLTDLKKLVKEITDQRMKKVNPPSSPPQPKQAATAGL